jgi:hypothetical protein
LGSVMFGEGIDGVFDLEYVGREEAGVGPRS